MTQDEEGRAPATIAVTQADREAAAAYMDRVKSTRWSIEGILSGGCDNTSIVQAFARHRTEAQVKLREALERQCDNMAFVLNHAELPDQWLDKFSRELEQDRAALRDMQP